MVDDKIENIIIDNNNLIYSIISKYRNYYDIDDLYQVAVMGIIKAYSNFDINSKAKFSTYAYKYILGEVLKYVSDNRSFKLSKEYLQLEKQISKARDVLTQKLMKKPSNFELSVFLEIDENIINQMEIVTKQIESLDKVIMEDGKCLTILDTISDKTCEHNIDNIYLYQELAKLDENEKRLLQSRYFLDKTQQETAQILGINQVQVSRNEKKILQKLRNNMSSCR